MSTSNICQYEPLSTISRKEIDRRFREVHRSLCYVTAAVSTQFSGTPGSVIFAGPTGILAQDNANFFWDDTNNRLGIGTNAPAFNLDVNSSFGASDRGYPASFNAGLPAKFYTVHGGGNWGFSISRATNDSGGANLAFYKTRNNNAANKSSALTGDVIGRISFQTVATDNLTVANAAQIVVVCGAPATTYVPSAYQIYTTNNAGGFNVRARISTEGNFYIGGDVNATALLQLKAGTTAASTAPLKFTSGSLMTTAEAGAVEFLTDKAYLTITTGAARKEITLNDSTLTANRIPFTTAGRLKTSDNLEFFDNFAQMTITDQVGSTAIYGNGQISCSAANTSQDPNVGLTNDLGSLFQIGVGASANGNAGYPNNAYFVYSGTKIFVDVSEFNFTATKGVYIGNQTTVPTAKLHIVAGTASAGTAPLKLTAGTNLTTPENGAFEFDGANLYFTVGGVRKTVTLTP